MNTFRMQAIPQGLLRFMFGFVFTGIMSYRVITILMLLNTYMSDNTRTDVINRDLAFTCVWF